jgi:hypothetical protein
LRSMWNQSGPVAKVGHHRLGRHVRLVHRRDDRLECWLTRGSKAVARVCSVGCWLLEGRKD